MIRLWTEARVERLKQLVGEGKLTLVEISDELKLSATQVRSKLYALRKEEQRYGKLPPPVLSLVKKFSGEPLPSTDTPEIKSLNIPLSDLNDGQCRWPTAEEGGKQLFCGCKAVGPYCVLHSRKKPRR